MPLRPPRRSSRARGDASWGRAARTRPSVVRSRRAWRALLRGSRGLAESYADGHWDSPDLTAVIRVAARNAPVLDALAPARVRRREPYQRARGALVRNTRSRSRARHRRALRPRQRAVRADARPDDAPTRARCSTGPDTSLEDASLAKLELVCEKLDARPVGPRAGDRHRLGRVRGARRRHARVPGHHAHDLARAACLRARPRARRRAGGPRRRAAAGLPRRARALRQARLDRDDRGGRLEGLRHVLRPLLGPAGTRRRDAPAGDHDRRPRLSGREVRRRASSEPTSSPTAASRRSR